MPPGYGALFSVCCCVRRPGRLTLQQLESTRASPPACLLVFLVFQQLRACANRNCIALQGAGGGKKRRLRYFSSSTPGLKRLRSTSSSAAGGDGAAPAAAGATGEAGAGQQPGGGGEPVALQPAWSQLGDIILL